MLCIKVSAYMKKLKTILIVLLSIIFVYTVAGFFILPPVLKSVLSKNLTQALHRSVTIEKIRLNPYTLAAEVGGLSVRDRDGEDMLASFRSLFLDVEWISIFRLSPVIREVRLEKPSLRIVRFEDNTYNFSDLMKGGKKSGKPLHFSVSNIQITGGRIVMDDRPVRKVHTAEDIAVTVPFLSNIAYYADVFVQPSLQATVNGTRFSLKGRSKPFSESLESSLVIDLKKIDIPYYLAYLPMKPGFTVQSGLLDINAAVTFRQFKGERKPESNLSGTAVCRDLAAVDADGSPLIRIPLLLVELDPSQPFKEKIHIRKIRITGPELALSRDRKGVLNLVRALKETKTGQASKPDEKKQKPSPGISVAVHRVELSKGTVSFTDLSGNSPVKLTAGDLTATASDMTTGNQGTGKVDLSCTVNQTGHLSAGASFALNPVSADIDLSLDGFQPAWVQPYFIDRVRILVRRGTLSSRGKVKMALKTNAPARIAFAGDVRLLDFASIDRTHARDLVSWKELSFSGIDLSTAPLRLAVREIGLSSPVSSVVIMRDGTSNIAALLGGKPSGKAAVSSRSSGEKKAPARISIGSIVFRNGRFTFNDRSLAPHYAASLSSISGSITGLTSDEFRKATVNLKARLDNQSPLSVTGSINPLKEDLFVDLAVRFSNIELSPVTPYSGKYLGYAIDKGKLSLGLNYLIDKKVLDARNDVLIDQLTFGDTVESKDATKLPVRLAVVLLRDNSGRIDLHLPVTGRTDDPDFHVGKVILTVLTNILTKAATSPFALLESLYPGSTELGYIDFEPGRANLSDQEKSKLDQLSKILTDRPALNLEMSGYADVQTDKAGLSDYLFERRLKEQKLKDILRQGRQASSVDDITIEQKEYGTYLAKAYKAFDFPGKPKNFLGLDKGLPDEDMKRLLNENIKVSDDDLRRLAEERAQKVLDYLVEAGKIDGSRIFLVKAKALEPEKVDKASSSRVSITIK
jgi:uncharacterized protein involved in outer membrane biogenesis